MIEALAHNSLLNLLRQLKIPNWGHHLTMSRLVGRALRTNRSCLIQTGIPPNSPMIPYRWSYLVPALLSPDPVIIVTCDQVHQEILNCEIPEIQKILPFKEITTGQWTDPDFKGILLTNPIDWFSDRLLSQDRFPNGVITIIDGIDDLEDWVLSILTFSFNPQDWDDLIKRFPHEIDFILNSKVKLTKSFFAHPQNPDDCYLLDSTETSIFLNLLDKFGLTFLTNNYNKLLWVSIERALGHFSIHCAPIEFTHLLSRIWTQQSVILIGGILDLENNSEFYQRQIGLPNDLTTIKFSTHQNGEISLYIPKPFPLPNTPQFQNALIAELLNLIARNDSSFIVIIVGDRPLKTQIGSILAAEFGSQVQVEKFNSFNSNYILITGWDFWRNHYHEFPYPQILAIATLPIPSIENPLVRGKVTYYKQHKKDWFRSYLLPTALRELQRAIIPIQNHSGLIAIFDSRIHYRHYGQLVFSMLSGQLTKLRQISHYPS